MSDLRSSLQAVLAGRYTIERELGRGGMATVFLAQDLKHKRSVAIKVLAPEIARSVGPQRFLREIEIAARLTHPHILPVFDSGEGEGVLYYVMPYVRGESLRQRLAREKRLPVDAAVQIAREIAGALDYAHRHGVVHRDIKPENVLLEEGHAIVADFGVARALAGDRGPALTEVGLAVGTPYYMSPEQSMGEGAFDGRTDLYALGCVLYEMLAGQPVFEGPTAQAVARQHLFETPRRLRAVRPEVPEAIERVVNRALAKSPDERYGAVGGAGVG
jgi:serine/threonine-protein kinase